MAKQLLCVLTLVMTAVPGVRLRRNCRPKRLQLSLAQNQS
jgi:hypothetical protein